jgi:phosphoglycolate phosphatase
MRTVLFDLDGTLTDPLLGITRSIQHALTSIGQYPPETNELTWCIGPPLLDSLRELVGDELAPQALEYYRDRFGKVGLYENALYSHVPDMLTRLTQAGLKLYVASSKPRIYVEPIIDHFGLRAHFAGIYGSELDGTRANKSDLIRYVLRETGAAPASTTMVGDRHHDIVGAVENGIDHIGVLYGYGTAEELRQSGAHRFADTPLDLVGLLL